MDQDKDLSQPGEQTAADAAPEQASGKDGQETQAASAAATEQISVPVPTVETPASAVQSPVSASAADESGIAGSGSFAAAVSAATAAQSAVSANAPDAATGQGGTGAAPVKGPLAGRIVEQAENQPKISVGSILNRGVSTIAVAPGFFLGLCFAISIPSVILSIMAEEIPALEFGSSIVDTLLGLLIQGAISFAVYRVLTHERFTAGDAMNRGMSHLFPMFGAAVLTTIGIVLGTLLLIIPGLVLMTMWAVVIPACVVEKLGATKSIGRSVELTQGNRWQVFGLVLVTYLLIIVLAFVGAFFGEVVTESEMVATVLAGVLVVPAVAYHSVVMAIVYFDLRTIKEGVSVDKLANVFD